MSLNNYYCRLCAEKYPQASLVSNNTSNFNKKRLDEYIFQYLCIRIDTNNNYPKDICLDCATTVLNFHTFARKVGIAQSKLNYLGNTTPENESVPIKVERLELTCEKVPLNNFKNDNKTSPFEEHQSTLARLLSEDGVSNNSIEFKQEVDLENQSDWNFENVLLDSKTSEVIIENVDKSDFSLENNLILNSTKNELDQEKLEDSKKFKKYRIWDCYLCCKCHTDLESLQKHFGTVHSVPVEYICYKCQALFSDLNEYKRHLFSDHEISLRTDKVARFKCKMCTFASNFLTNFRNHLLTHSGIKKFKCDVCGKKFSLKSHLETHSLTHKQEFNVLNTKVQLPKIDRSAFYDIFKCVKCDSSFDSLDEIEIHMNRIHENISIKFNCPRCDKALAQKHELIAHLKKDHKRYQCRLCNKEMDNRGAFINHYYIHKGIKRFSCDICDKSFLLKQHAKVHRLRHEKLTVNCDQCDKTFPSKPLLRRHQKTHRKKEKRQFECGICQKKFVSKGYVAEHKRMVHEETTDYPYVCEKCGKSFKLAGTLVLHATTHNSDNNFQCDKCPKAFKNIYILKNHKLVHAVEKPFKCDICGTKFKHQRSMSRHNRIHQNKMPFECEFCKKRFTERSYLKVHLRQHTGERPYACLECNHYFANDSNYRKHLRGRHGLENICVINNHQYPFVNQQND